MRKSTKIVLVVGAAGCVLLGATSAFTASNTLPATDTAGYGSSSVTGVAVSAIHYTQDSSDASKLDKVVFDTSTDITTVAKTSTLTLELAGGTKPQFTCANASGTPNTITCVTSASGGVNIADINKTDLTVVDS
ncbi:hypothetical protein [uncultured Jatrophihabitans sp.]|uniref:hypothetical protein n=1 Tax=uncultured Jatrophihabitans sp. TaxID=1610747 RepID=UPI0035CBD97D